MTMPKERRNAVLHTQKLLIDIINGEYVDDYGALQDEAVRCLKHYPSEYYMDEASDQAPDVFEK